MTNQTTSRKTTWVVSSRYMIFCFIALGLAVMMMRSAEAKTAEMNKRSHHFFDRMSKRATCRPRPSEGAVNSQSGGDSSMMTTNTDTTNPTGATGQGTNTATNTQSGDQSGTNTNAPTNTQTDAPTTTTNTDGATTTNTDGQGTGTETGTGTTGQQNPTDTTTTQNNGTTTTTSGTTTPTGGQTNGKATVYAPGLGACGQTNSDADFIVAVSADLFSTSPCGKTITAKCTQFDDQHCTSSAQAITVQVQDKCPGCDPTHLDLSPAAWNKLTGNMAPGVVTIDWSWA